MVFGMCLCFFICIIMIWMMIVVVSVGMLNIVMMGFVLLFFCRLSIVRIIYDMVSVLSMMVVIGCMGDDFFCVVVFFGVVILCVVEVFCKVGV